MSKKVVPIKYTSRDYESIRADLLQHAKRYYPDSFKDFSEASFGAMMVDTVSYVGDILSFYLDYQTNESFLDTAIEYNNVVRHGRQMGYKFQGRPVATGVLTFYIIVPALDVGLGPNLDYLPILERGSIFSANNGNTYILMESVDFSNDPRLEVVAATEDENGNTLSYALRAHGQVMAGRLVTDNVTVGNFRRFFRTPIAGRNVIEILSVVDSQGNEYFEVEHLSQNAVYASVVNKGSDRSTVREILKPVIVPRRFVVQKEQNITFLQFGYGSEENLKSNLIADPSNIALDLHGRDYISSTSFDPNKLMQTDKFGVGPADTTLTVRYLITNLKNSNASVSSVTKVVAPLMTFPAELTGLTLSKATKRTVISSLECSNEDQLIGSISQPTAQELRVRIGDNFAAQKRAVTKKDYSALSYAMPAKFGAVKRLAIYQDQDSFKRNMNMYVISEDSSGNLIQSSNTIKQNLSTWMRKHKMVGDTIDILDAKILNFGIEFTAVATSDANKTAVLDAVVAQIRNNVTASKFEIGEPFYLSDLYRTINLVDGVLDTIDVRLLTRVGGAYSDVDLELDSLIDHDGRVLTPPDNVILELKSPFKDIVGIIK
tara:strand:+ start:2944 stop:4749 length:1806 start_codon:yes stop_codon:yes gene_type:complete